MHRTSQSDKLRGGILRNWMKNLRETSGLTMKEAAAKLGISESYYCAIENGTRKKEMGLNLISGLAKTFGVSISDVVSFEMENK